MDADELKAMYADMCQQEMQVRRSTGLGSARVATDYDASGNARLYSATELVGTVMQGDQRVILLVDGAGRPRPDAAAEDHGRHRGRRHRARHPVDRRAQGLRRHPDRI
jgi:hypothetical protein